MSKKASIIVGLILILGLSAFNYHKFYVSIYQIDFVPEKKRVEITARIFMDDLILALEQEFKTKINLGETSETAQDVVFLQKYFSKNLRFFIDGKEKTAFFVSKEIENNVVIVYLKIMDVKKINSLKMRNNLLLEVYSDQQNIMQTNIYSKKRNYIFTRDYVVETITF
jgi:hypothetical protein